MADSIHVSLDAGLKDKLKEKGVNISEVCRKALLAEVGETSTEEDLEIELAGLESEWEACKKEDAACANQIHAALLPFRENHDGVSFLKTLINNYHVGKGALVVE